MVKEDRDDDREQGSSAGLKVVYWVMLSVTRWKHCEAWRAPEPQQTARDDNWQQRWAISPPSRTANSSLQILKKPRIIHRLSMHSDHKKYTRVHNTVSSILDLVSPALAMYHL